MKQGQGTQNKLLVGGVNAPELVMRVSCNKNLLLLKDQWGEPNCRDTRTN